MWTTLSADELSRAKTGQAKMYCSHSESEKSPRPIVGPSQHGSMAKLFRSQHYASPLLKEMNLVPSVRCSLQALVRKVDAQRPSENNLSRELSASRELHGNHSPPHHRLTKPPALRLHQLNRQGDRAC